MNEASASVERFFSIPIAAAKLGLPQAYLKREAKAGAIPALRAGGRWYVRLAAVADALAQRAASAPAGGIQ